MYQSNQSNPDYQGYQPSSSGMDRGAGPRGPMSFFVWGIIACVSGVWNVWGGLADRSFPLSGLLWLAMGVLMLLYRFRKFDQTKPILVLNWILQGLTIASAVFVVIGSLGVGFVTGGALGSLGAGLATGFLVMLIAILGFAVESVLLYFMRKSIHAAELCG